MPYREKKIYSGPILEVEIYPISLREKKQKRKDKKKESLPKQKKLNDKNARKHFIRLLNTNFTNQDIVVHLTYKDSELPKSEEEARKDIVNYIRRVKHYRKKNNLPELKYMAVIEYKEPKGNKKGTRMHHHVVMSGMDRDIVEGLWKKGWANADRLQGDEFAYEALGRYMAKDPKGSKRWCQSKNLKQPHVDVNDSYYTRRKIYEIAKSPDDENLFRRYSDKNYILNECKVEVNKETDAIYLYIKMRKLE